jgi:hypothetical protein
MNLAYANKDNYKEKLSSNLYDYLVLTEEGTEFNDEFETYIADNAKYQADVYYADYSIEHEVYTQNIFGRSIIFNELKSKPNFIKNPVIKTSVIRKFGIDLDAIVRPENRLLFWHIPKLLFKIKG